MKHLPLIMMIVVGPMSAHALMGFDVHGAGSIAAAQVIQIESSGSVKSVTSSSASSGGNSVSSGGNVTTGSAESHVETTIKAGEGGGTVDIKAETSVNGKTSTEEIHKEYAPGEAIDIRIATSSSSASTKDAMGTATATASEAALRDTAPETPEAKSEQRSLFRSVFFDASLFFSRFLRLFAFWS